MSYKARAEYTGPLASYPFAFPFLDETHVKLYVNGVEDTDRTLPASDPESGGSAVASVTVGASDTVVVVRETPSGPLVDFQGAAMLTEADLDTANLQSLYVAEEAEDRADLSIAPDPTDGKWDAASIIIKNVPTPVDGTDAANKTYVDTQFAANVASAQAAQAAAETAQAAAELAEDGAIDAQALAEAAEMAAVIAQGLSEDARDDSNLWATEAENVPVNDGVNPAGYSAFHHATKASASAGAALTSETNAAASEAAAAGYAAAAGTSETNAAASEAAAGTSETNAAASASASAGSASAAATSASNAATSETNAASSASAAATSASNAATSEANAASSAATAAAIVAGTVTFQGTYDASSGVLPTPVTDVDQWVISVGGSAGGFDFIQGDMLFYAGSTWYKVDNTEPSAVMKSGDTMTGNLVIVGPGGTALSSYSPNTSTAVLHKGDNQGVRIGFDAIYAYIDAVTAGLTDYAPLIVNGKTSMSFRLDSGAFSMDLSTVDGLTVNGAARATKGMPMNSTSASTWTVDSGANGYFFGFEAACTVTIPTNASDPVPIGAEFVFWQMSSSTVTFSPAGGVTLRSKDSKVDTNGQYSAVTLKKIGTDDWVLFGDLA